MILYIDPGENNVKTRKKFTECKCNIYVCEEESLMY